MITDSLGNKRRSKVNGESKVHWHTELVFFSNFFFPTNNKIEDGGREKRCRMNEKSKIVGEKTS